MPFASSAFDVRSIFLSFANLANSSIGVDLMFLFNVNNG